MKNFCIQTLLLPVAILVGCAGPAIQQKTRPAKSVAVDNQIELAGQLFLPPFVLTQTSLDWKHHTWTFVLVDQLGTKLVVTDTPKADPAHPMPRYVLGAPNASEQRYLETDRDIAVFLAILKECQDSLLSYHQIEEMNLKSFTLYNETERIYADTWMYFNR